jgi:hypothetical protein
LAAVWTSALELGLGLVRQGQLGQLVRGGGETHCCPRFGRGCQGEREYTVNRATRTKRRLVSRRRGHETRVVQEQRKSGSTDVRKASE